MLNGSSAVSEDVAEGEDGSAAEGEDSSAAEGEDSSAAEGEDGSAAEGEDTGSMPQKEKGITRQMMQEALKRNSGEGWTKTVTDEANVRDGWRHGEVHFEETGDCAGSESLVNPSVAGRDCKYLVVPDDLTNPEVCGSLLIADFDTIGCDCGCDYRM